MQLGFPKKRSIGIVVRLKHEREWQYETIEQSAVSIRKYEVQFNYDNTVSYIVAYKLRVWCNCCSSSRNNKAFCVMVQQPAAGI